MISEIRVKFFLLRNLLFELVLSIQNQLKHLDLLLLVEDLFIDSVQIGNLFFNFIFQDLEVIVLSLRLNSNVFKFFLKFTFLL